jgi:hypothetical protein
MLKQEDLAFLKAISAAKQSPAPLRDLRKALSASKEKRAVAVRETSGPAKAPTRREDGKRKTSQSGLDSSTEPATRRPAPELASGSSSCATTATEGQVAISSFEKQWPAYAAVTAGRAGQSHQRRKPKVIPASRPVEVAREGQLIGGLIEERLVGD